MSSIHQLPTILANQIAAGEVIERPASVVKELVENALDAQATKIEIHINAGGLESIEVIDNGQGIAKDEVLLAFERHATSKIFDRADLFKIQSLGFRGEALPSVASISDVKITTAQAQQPGYSVSFHGGKVVSEGLASRSTGTTITVENLFFNTPARLKYLSSPQSELSAISDMVNRLALGHPDVAFALYHDEKKLLQTVGNNNLQQVIGAIYGLTTAKQMLKFNKEQDGFKVSGYLALPKLTRASRKYLTILVNGRYIKNFQVMKAFLEGYGSKLMVGRYPLAVVNIEIDPLLIDVNVHPTKQEVRFANEDQLLELITKTVQNRLAAENLIPNALTNLRANQTVTEEQLALNINEPAAPYQITELKPVIIKTKADLNKPEVQAFKERYQKQGGPGQPKEQQIHTQQFLELTYIGQIHGTYLCAQSPDGFYLIDQHAAQERVKYEFYRKEIIKDGQQQQNLLVPIILTYPTSESLLINQNLAKLQELGLYLEEFGQNAYILHAHPQWLPANQEEQYVRDMIDMLLADPKLTVAKVREQTAIMMSCKQSIKANHFLEPKQATALLKQLSQCENPFNCPHGRPTLVHFSGQDLQKMFKRIQDSHESNKY